MSQTQASATENGLDAPPPNPATQTGLNPGTPLGSLVPPVQSNQIPPAMLTGIMQEGQQMSQTLDAFAQAMPDLAQDCAVVKESLLQLLSKVLMAGSGPTSPTAPGPNFPGGGVDRGGAPPLAPLGGQGT